MVKPIIAISMGDAAGIGPELIAKALSQPDIRDVCRPVVVADPRVLAEACRIADTGLEVRSIANVREAAFGPTALDVICPEGVSIGQIPWGAIDAAMGQAGALCLKECYRLAMGGEVQGVVSAPLNKEAFHLAGYDYSDELAYLADYTGSKGTFMLGVMDKLWTVVLTEHIPFRDILGHIKRERVLWYIQQMHAILSKLDPGRARIAVAALNVHAGEGGLYGREEIDEMAPAISDAQAQGIQVVGPVPADMVFVLALAGTYDGVVCMYHDQANIARKLQPKEQSATIFWGLPVVCGTTAHGTAFDIAGKGIAHPGSLCAALRNVARLATAGH